MTEPATSGRPSDPGTPGNQPQDVGEVVDRLLNRLAWIILTLGTAATLGTLNRWVQHGWHIQHAIHVAVFLLLCAGVLLKRIPRNSRVAMILGALAVSGVCNLFFHGLAGTGFVFLTIVCVLAWCSAPCGPDGSPQVCLPQ